MMRPSVFMPTGTRIGAPVSVTAWPRTRPSVTSIAIVRTEDSPRCCATSSTRRLPLLVVSSALRISGRCPSNCTSTTAPMTCVMRPVATRAGADFAALLAEAGALVAAGLAAALLTAGAFAAAAFTVGAFVAAAFAAGALEAGDFAAGVFATGVLAMVVSFVKSVRALPRPR